MKYLFQRQGFSFLELLVVVAILGILATIAIPSYRGTIERARQKEGLAILNGYYSAAQATRAEFGRYPGEFVQTGFAPVGELGYRLVAVDNANNINIPIADPLCVSTNSACTCAGQCPGFRTWVERPAGAIGVNLGPVAPGVGVNCAGVMTGPAIANDTFVVLVAGVISLRSTSIDRWGINQAKVLANCTDGTL